VVDFFNVLVLIIYFIAMLGLFLSIVEPEVFFALKPKGSYQMGEFGVLVVT